MNRNVLIVPAVVAALSLATSAWAGGGGMCSGKSEGAAKQVSAEKAAGGSHCTTDKASASMASGKQCTIGADNAVFSFAVNEIHCGACVTKIQEAAMAQKGVLCAKVSLDTKMAYVAGDKKLNKKVIAKAIKDAGYKCTFKAQGPKARAELLKMMAAESTPTTTEKKDKV